MTYPISRRCGRSSLCGRGNRILPPGAVDLDSNLVGAARFRIPADAQPGQTIHLILEATDNGSPALTHYQRVVITVAGPNDRVDGEDHPRPGVRTGCAQG